MNSFCNPTNFQINSHVWWGWESALFLYWVESAKLCSLLVVEQHVAVRYSMMMAFFCKINSTNNSHSLTNSRQLYIPFCIYIARMYTHTRFSYNLQTRTQIHLSECVCVSWNYCPRKKLNAKVNRMEFHCV